MKFIPLSVAASLFALVTGAEASERAVCECVMPEITDSLKSAEIVFVGDVLAVDRGLATIRVVERLKGRVKDKVEVIDGYPGLCIWSVFHGTARYLVYANAVANSERLQTPSECPMTRRLDELTARDIHALSRFVKANKKALDPGLPK